MKIIGIIFSVLIAVTLSIIFNGYALSILWDWFVVDTFDAPSLSLLEAIGVAMVVSFLTNHHTEDEGDGKSMSEKIIKSVILTIIRPSFALFFGWVVTLFM